MNLESYQDAKNKLLSGDFSVGSFFKENGYVLEYGYSRLLSGDFEWANSILENIADQDFRANWAVKLIQFMRCYVAIPPSYFQIRNFLEIDLNLLIQAGQPELVENIINGADLFYSVNPESYKFIARVMLFNDFIDIALHYLTKAKEALYKDPEMHFLLATCYIKQNQIQMAKKALKDCLTILPGYFPAKNLEKTLVYTE